MADPSGRGGFALMVAVLMLAGLTLLLHGAFLLARHDGRVARVGVELLQARGRAEVGMGEAGAPGTRLPDVAVGDGDELTGSGPGGRHRVRRLRVAREWWVLDATGEPLEGTARVRLRGARWALDVPSRVASFRGVVEVGPAASVVGVGRVDGSAVRSPASGRTGLACHRWGAVLDSLGLGALASTAVRGFPDGGPVLGLLGRDTLLARIPVHVEGEGTPGPSGEGGRCGGEELWNWGDPRQDATLCRARMVTRGSTGDLVVRGGVGQGLLVTAGDVLLTAGADVRGMILAGGALVVEEGAAFHGLAQARGGLRVAPDSRIVGSACWAAAAVEGAATFLGGALSAAAGEPLLALPPG